MGGMYKNEALYADLMVAYSIGDNLFSDPCF